MGKATKQTKKFLKNGLEKEYERRNKARPLKQAFAKRQKKKLDKLNAPPKDDDCGLPAAAPIGDMDVDEFMAKGFKDILNEGGDVSDDEKDDEEDQDSGGDDNDDDLEEDDAAQADSEDDVSDDEETSLLRDSNGEMKGEIGTHKQSLDSLKAAQPEFYKFLQENDKDLLDFAEDDSADSESEDEAEDTKSESTTSKAKTSKAKSKPKSESKMEEDEADDDEEEEEDEPEPEQQHMTLVEAKKLVANLQSKNKVKSVVALRKLVSAFKSICKSDEEEEEFALEEGPSATTQGYIIKSCYRLVPLYFEKNVAVPNKQNKLNPPLPLQSKAWKRLANVIKSFLKTCLEFSATVTDVDTASFALHCMLPLCRFYASIPKYNRLLFKLMLTKWSGGSEAVRVNAFLVIRKMTIVSPYPFIETSLKGTYLTFVRNCKFPTATMRPTLRFMLNCVVELYRLDESATYQHAFVYIRQLSIHLRNAIVSKKKDAHVQVYNWQFIYAMRVWAKLLAEEATTNMDGLKALIYPFVQVAIGAMNLVPSSRYMPHKFHCINMLVELMEKTGVYIPLSAHIMDALDISEMKKKPKPATGKPLIFEAMLRVSKKQLPLPQFQDAVLKNALDSAVKFYGSLATSISFPECVYPDTVRLRKYIKTCKAKHITKKLRVLLEKLEENSEFIMSARANVGFSPKDVAKADAWSAALKQGAKSPLQRHYKVWLAADANRRKMNEAVQEAEGDDFEKQAKDSDEEDNEEEEDAESTATEKNTKKKKAQATTKEADDDADAMEEDDDDEDEDDVVGEFAMSDFELSDSE